VLPAGVQFAHPLWIGEPAPPGEIREAATLLIESYRGLTDLATAAFGAVAFFVAYQQQRGVELSTWAWSLLGAALLLLFGALMFSLLGRELLVSMISANAVAIDAVALQVGRRAFYICFLVAAIAVGVFALDVALTPPRADHLES
jgi:dolichyl-phosphate-mannose--protein O-mannosyl transferase